MLVINTPSVIKSLVIAAKAAIYTILSTRLRVKPAMTDVVRSLVIAAKAAIYTILSTRLRVKPAMTKTANLKAIAATVLLLAGLTNANALSCTANNVAAFRNCVNNASYDTIDVSANLLFSFDVGARNSAYRSVAYIDWDITINGGGNTITIYAGENLRHFYVESNATLTLKNITLSNGNIKGGDGADGPEAGSGGLGAGGSIFAEGNVTLENVYFVSNTATGGNGGSAPSGLAIGGGGGMAGDATAGTGGAGYGSFGAGGNSGTVGQFGGGSGGDFIPASEYAGFGGGIGGSSSSGVEGFGGGDTRGQAYGAGGAGMGGAIFMKKGVLKLKNVSFFNNYADGGENGVVGGGTHKGRGYGGAIFICTDYLYDIVRSSSTIAGECSAAIDDSEWSGTVFSGNSAETYNSTNTGDYFYQDQNVFGNYKKLALPRKYIKAEIDLANADSGFTDRLTIKAFAIDNHFNYYSSDYPHLKPLTLGRGESGTTYIFVDASLPSPVGNLIVGYSVIGGSYGDARIYQTGYLTANSTISPYRDDAAKRPTNITTITGNMKPPRGEVIGGSIMYPASIGGQIKLFAKEAKYGEFNLFSRRVEVDKTEDATCTGICTYEIVVPSVPSGEKWIVGYEQTGASDGVGGNYADVGYVNTATGTTERYDEADRVTPTGGANMDAINISVTVPVFFRLDNATFNRAIVVAERNDGYTMAKEAIAQDFFSDGVLMYVRDDDPNNTYRFKVYPRNYDGTIAKNPLYANGYDDGVGNIIGGSGTLNKSQAIDFNLSNPTYSSSGTLELRFDFGGGASATPLALSKGWNLVSLPAKGALSNLDLWLMTHKTAIEEIYTFRAYEGFTTLTAGYNANDIWYHFDATTGAYDKPYLKRLTELSSEEGFWIYSGAAFQLPYYANSDPLVNENPLIQAGWNLVGFNSDQSVAQITSYMSTLGLEPLSIWTHKGGGWQIYIAGETQAPKGVGWLTSVSKTDGVWINAKTK
ncbi:hypothetical protein AGMMS49521_3310 [Campylobacterota bacterium]|nr:hypothetical protein AGMMS49521_3310 [Campylobacterota bacterium]